MKKLKTWFCCFLATLCALLMVGCSYEYEGKHADLYSMACKNLIAINGYIPQGEYTDDPLIYELEKDEYGRVLFSYQEFGSVVHLLIMQKSENNLVYYYPEDCYLSFRTELSKYLGDFTQQDLMQILQTHLTEEDRTAFKALNDWNEPLQEEKCDSTPITRNPPKGGRVANNSPVYEKVLLQYFEKVCGASPERIEKADIIKHLLNSTPDIINAVMVGDTMTDVNGAMENNIPTVAVLWGYGDKAEISNFSYAVAGTTDELYEILKQ